MTNKSGNSEGEGINSSVRIRMMIWIVMLIGGAMLCIALDQLWFHQLFLNPWWHLTTMLPGIILLKLVFTISKVTGRTLAQQGRKGELPRFETNQLVISGPYGCMRHPMHFGLLFFPLVVALILGSPTFILFIAPAEIVFMVVMILIFEEREAICKFGDLYIEYKKAVPAFNLHLTCLKKLLST